MHAETTCAMKNHFELRFESLFNPGRDYTFPCDAHGRVDMDALTERGLSNYLFVRAAVGREFLTPMIRRPAIA